jgi:metal-sulfur cluster biosynthetic enzyme
MTESTPAEATGPALVGGKSALLEDLEEAMRDVVDPELGINVVDLGLVYGIHVDPQRNVVLDMTLTSAACPLTDVIEDQTRNALAPLAASATINWVWMPPWGPEKITDDGREQLRALGFNV